MRRTGAYSLLLAAALGCNGGSGTGPGPEPTPQPDPVPTTLAVSPAEPAVPDGGTRQLTATVTDQRGNVMSTLPGGAVVAWTSRDAAVASVDGNGLVTALRPGTSWIRAGVGAIADSTRVTVTVVATHLAVSGSAERAGTTGRLLADSLAVRVTDRHGTGVAGVSVAFATAGGELTPATVVTGADGTAKAAWRLGPTPGEQTATATVAGLAGSPVTFRAAAAAPVPASVTLAPAFATLNVGATQLFGATVRTADGEVIPGAPVTFASTSTATASLSGGTATGVAPGVARIVASLGALADSATVAVLGPASVLATAFPGGAIHATAQRGDTVRVPVVLDLSRPSPTNELGSAQLDVVFDPAVLEFVRAENVPGNAVWHLRAPGRFGLAFAATEPQAPGPVRLATLVLVVRGDAVVGAVSRFQTEFAEPPRSTALAPFSAPVIVAGRVRIH
ncbi:MAG TPA: Ig-like domain-containing protein [Longimicrobium sp.]